MSSTTFNDHYHHHNHPKTEPNENSGSGVGILYPPTSPLLKLNKDSHVIKKPPSPSSSSSAGKPRHPVIIYTHTPKIIHTNPKDFMALVQKLTGMSRSSDEDPGGNTTIGRVGKSIDRSVSDLTVDKKVNRNRSGSGHNNYNRNYSGTGAGNRKGIFFNNAMINEDSESSSVITTEENIGEAGQVNSSLPYSAMGIPPPPPPPPSYDGINYGSYFSTTYPIFPAATNPSVDNFMCNGNQTFGNYDDPLYYATNMRISFSSSSSSSGFDGLNEFREF